MRRVPKRAMRDSSGSLFSADASGTGADEEPFDDEAADPEYVTDPADGLPAETIKPHSQDKHLIVRRYVDICRGVRGTWLDEFAATATYIDLFCGPGRACDPGGTRLRDGSPLIAWDTSLRPSKPPAHPFSHLYIADKNSTLLDAATRRLELARAVVKPFCGKAEATVDKVINELSEGFHFALLDPYGIKQLPFEIIRKLVEVPHLDLLIHVSGAGLRRNLGFNVRGEHSNFDRFDPGWRDVFNPTRPDEENVRAIFSHWGREIAKLGKQLRGTVAVATDRKVPLYWLVLVSGHPLAGRFWDEIKHLREQEPLQLSLA